MLVVHICVLSFEGVPLIGAVITPQASDQLPYDIVSMVYDQDMDRVKAVMDTYDVDVQIYPMVRVSSISGNSSLQQDERSVNTEQGAYIGITEDTYRSLKEALGEKSKDLDLKRRRDLHGLPAECFHAFPEPGLQRIQNGKLSPVRTASLLLQCRPQARAFPRT